jgi:hypothetical protein
MAIGMSNAHCKNNTLILRSKHGIRRGTDLMKATKCRYSSCSDKTVEQLSLTRPCSKSSSKQNPTTTAQKEPTTVKQLHWAPTENIIASDHSIK